MAKTVTSKTIKGLENLGWRQVKTTAKYQKFAMEGKNFFYFVGKN